MPSAIDYRTLPFHITKVRDSGKYIGHGIYWKLYVIENILRITICSVLSAQIGPSTWWASITSDTLREKIEQRKETYRRQPRKSSPGSHDIYFLFLPEITNIISNNSQFFLPVLPDIDLWIRLLDRIKLPRNIVGHMNWLNVSDKESIDLAYEQLSSITKTLKLSSIAIKVPK